MSGSRSRNTTRAVVLRALNRFGLGARPGEAGAISHPRGWLEAQLTERRAIPRGVEEPLSMAVRSRVFEAQRDARLQKDQEGLQEARRQLRAILASDVQRSLTRRVTTDTPYVERLVAFWSNHLCVSTSKAFVGPLAGPYEDAVIRPHVLGRFEDMVLASARHPAMLLFLDNAQSVGPGSIAGSRGRNGAPKRGLNENYARELLELHTVGVDGGYGQDDVRELAHILTGWSVGGVGPLAGDETEIDFVFRSMLHDPEPRTVLGQRYGQRGESQGRAAITALCRHPSTARFLSTKLVRHFVSDDPPVAAIDTITRVFRNSGGNLATVALALIHLEEAWAPDQRKFRTPQDWLVASLRALEAEAVGPPWPGRLTPLRQPLWRPPSPKGYGDSLREWGDPDGLMNRAELAQSLAARVGRGRVDPRELANVVENGGEEPFTETLSDSSLSRRDRIALALAGPAFQWR